MTRWYLGGGNADVGIPAAPSFSLSAPGAGVLQLSQIDFADLSNASSITSGTLQVYSWNELQTPSSYTLAAATDALSTTLQLTGMASSFPPGTMLQIGSEVLTVIAPSAANAYQVARAATASSADAHAAGDPVMPLQVTTIVVPFASGFFENRASQNFLHPFNLPDVRVAAAQLYMTNSFGDGLSSEVCYLSGGQNGLRTLSGGQFTLQLSGFLATQQNAAPPLAIGATHAVHDIRASVLQPASGYTTSIDVLQNGNVYCSLEINSGNNNANAIIDGTWLPPLQDGTSVTMNVTLSPLAGFSGSLMPGRDLTVTVRL